MALYRWKEECKGIIIAFHILVINFKHEDFCVHLRTRIGADEAEIRFFPRFLCVKSPIQNKHQNKHKSQNR